MFYFNKGYFYLPPFYIYIVNEIEAKIQELAHKDDPENTHNFTVEL